MQYPNEYQGWIEFDGCGDTIVFPKGCQPGEDEDDEDEDEEME